MNFDSTSKMSKMCIFVMAVVFEIDYDDSCVGPLQNSVKPQKVKASNSLKFIPNRRDRVHDSTKNRTDRPAVENRNLNFE